MLKALLSFLIPVFCGVLAGAVLGLHLRPTAPATPADRPLKNPRQSLQECLEDDATGKGSASRLALILGAMAITFGLVVALAYHLMGTKDMTGIIQTLVWGASSGTAAPYTFKRVMEAFRGSAPAQTTDPGPEGAGQ